MDLVLPARPWLDLSVGTIEQGPVTIDVMPTLLERLRALGYIQ